MFITIKNSKLIVIVFSFLACLSLILLYAFGEDIYHSAVFSKTDDNGESYLVTEVISIPESGYYLYVDLDTCLMTVYKDGVVYKTYPVSGGKASTPSPLGTWTIISKADWGEGFGGTWMGFNVPYGKYGIHGTIYPWVIGNGNSSKGCIRMLNKDANELKKMVYVGTQITIVHENPIFRVLSNGKTGSDVKKLQEALKKLGYFKGTPNSKFGPETQKAVMAYQKDKKLKQDGVVGKKLFNTIIEQSKRVEPALDSDPT